MFTRCGHDVPLDATDENLIGERRNAMEERLHGLDIDWLSIGGHAGDLVEFIIMSRNPEQRNIEHAS